MSLQRFAIRTKKSLSGLYFSRKEKDHVSSRSSPGESASRFPVTPPKSLRSTADESGDLRSDDDASPSKDSPSRRHRLLGSLRSMRSLRGLRAIHSSSKKSDEEATKPESPHTPVRKKPSLCLNFETSRVDEPMFDPMTRKASGSSSLRVHHSSPISVPFSSRHTTPMVLSTSPGPTTFAVGTVPDSPAPLRKASVQEAIVNNATKANLCPESSPINVAVDPLPTPMPGTNLALEDVTAPGIVVTSPSAPSMREQRPAGYFDVNMDATEDIGERTATLVTESGFPTFDNANAATVEGSATQRDVPAAPAREEVVSEKPEPAVSDETRSAVQENNSFTCAAARSPPASNDYGDELAYIVWDCPGKARTKRARNWNRVAGLYDGTGYGSGEATTSSRQGTDNTDTATTEMTELTELTNHEDEPSEAGSIAAIKELDAATPTARPLSPADDKKALQDDIGAYGSPIYREGTENSSDVKGSASLAQDGIAEEVREEVETSIRVMSRSLGG